LQVAVFYCSDFDTGAYSGGDCGVVNSPDGPYILAPEIALPVELTSFYGDSSGDANILNWVTETEINNDFFILEKSYDALSFEEVAVLNGAGNNVGSIRYEALDFDPKKTTYYRLSQVDFDGNTEVFKVIVVINNTRKKERNKLLKVVNLLGRIVPENYSGVVIEYYTNGLAMKKIRM